MGRYLDLAERAIKEEVHLTAPPAGASVPQWEISAAIPAGAILLALRYDGVGKPLASVPHCWCCQIPWELERLEEWKGKTYAFLKPSCGCLNVPQALACCGLCVEHCRCRRRQEKARTDPTPLPKTSENDFGTPTVDGDAR